MPGPIEIADDYRHAILRNMPAREVARHTKPSLEELKVRASHYAPIIDAYIPPNPKARVLELGCGWGAFLKALHERGYRDLHAVEMLPECCELVREAIGLEVAQVDIFDYLAKAEGPYDVIAAFDVIEHFKKNEIVAMLTRIKELLAPGGVFVMRVPNCGSLGGLSTLHAAFTHETGFTRNSADEILVAMGFTDVRCMPEPLFGRTPFRGVVRRAIRRAFGEVLSLAMLRTEDPRFIVSHNLIAGGKKP